MNSSTDLWGQDIALDEHGQALVAADGSLILTEGVDTGVQDVKLRLFTPLGELFYDTDFGSLIHEWIYEESTDSSRMAFVSEVVMRIENDPRVQPYTVTCDILSWNERQLVAAVRWYFIGHDQPNNLVMQADKQTKELIIRDGTPDSTSFSADIPDY